MGADLRYVIQNTLDKSVCIKTEAWFFMFLRMCIGNGNRVAVIPVNPLFRYGAAADIAANIFENTVGMRVSRFDFCVSFFPSQFVKTIQAPANTHAGRGN